MGLVGEVLKSSFSVRTKVKGSSMLPFIRTGDYITIIPVSVGAVRIGDIVAYADKKQKNIICHRLIKIRQSALILKGDTHLWTFEEVAAEFLLGKVILVEHGKNRLNLENKLYRLLAPMVAWISHYFPPLLFITGYCIEIARNPQPTLFKIFGKIRRVCA